MSFHQITHLLFTERDWKEHSLDTEFEWTAVRVILPHTGYAEIYADLCEQNKHYTQRLSEDSELVSEVMIYATIDNLVPDTNLIEQGIEYTEWGHTFYTSGSDSHSYEWMRLGKDGIPVRYSNYIKAGLNLPNDILEYVDDTYLDFEQTRRYIRRRCEREALRMDTPLYDDGTRKKIWKTHNLLFKEEEIEPAWFSIWDADLHADLDIRFRDRNQMKQNREHLDARDLFY